MAGITVHNLVERLPEQLRIPVSFPCQSGTIDAKTSILRRRSSVA